MRSLLKLNPKTFSAFQSIQMFKSQLSWEFLETKTHCLATVINEFSNDGDRNLPNSSIFSQRASTAIAKTDCRLAYLERKNFLFAVQQTPMFALEVMKSYSDRIRRLRQSVC